MKQLVIAGGGFAGIWGAMAAAATRDRVGADVEISLISRDDALCIRPRLYEGALAEALVPIKPLMDVIGVQFVHAKLSDIQQSSVVADNRNYAFDAMLFCLGSQMYFPQIPGAEKLGFSIDDYFETQRLDAHLRSLEQNDEDPTTIMVVGASFTGIELVTRLRMRLGENVRLILVDREAKPGANLGSNLTGEIRSALDVANVEFLAETSLKRVTPEGVVLSDGSEIATRTVVFATGITASPLASHLSGNVESDGRIAVDQMLRVPGKTNLFAAGDVARAQTDEQNSTLMSCQHAMPMGAAAGQNAVLALSGNDLRPYAQPFYATCIDLGPAGAVFTTGWDRRIDKKNAEGAAMKSEINTKWIYPPAPELGRESIFAQIEASLNDS
ncbi:MAG: FAD-dependent oxidoreductase [Pseudomonadota bacterium]